MMAHAGSRKHFPRPNCMKCKLKPRYNMGFRWWLVSKASAFKWINYARLTHCSPWGVWTVMHEPRFRLLRRTGYHIQHDLTLRETIEMEDLTGLRRNRMGRLPSSDQESWMLLWGFKLVRHLNLTSRQWFAWLQSKMILLHQEASKLSNKSLDWMWEDVKANHLGQGNACFSTSSFFLKNSFNTTESHLMHWCTLHQWNFLHDYIL